MEQIDVAVFAGIQKSKDLDVNERHALEVQRDGRLFAINLHLQLIEMLKLHPTA